MSNRKPNGDGSIRQRSDGRWEGRYTAPDGRQRSVYGKTKTACREKLRQAQAEILTGVYLEPSRVTVGEWLTMWLEAQADRVKPSTQQTYQAYVDRYLAPALGEIRLDKLAPVHVQRAFSDLARRLSPGSVMSVRTFLASALNAAVKLELIRSNPLHKLPPPRKPDEEPMTLVDRKDFPAFVAAARNTKFATALILLLQTGIRSGELRGLRWADVDLDAATMTVSRQITYLTKGPVVQSPKSGRIRRIVLMPETVALLRRHRADQAAQRLAHGGWVDDDLSADLVFRRKDGRPLAGNALRAPATRVGAAIGLPGLHPHDLRHSYAVAAIRSGIDVKTVQNNLGHATAAMTLDVYAGYTDDMGRAAAERMSQYWQANI